MTVPTLPGFRYVKPLGRGGYGEVFSAYQDQFDRWVAVKALSFTLTDERLQRQFVRECKLAGRLSAHPNIVTVYDSGIVAGGRPYITMELFPDGSIADALRQGPFAVPDALRIGILLAGALETAHRAGVVHRDVKPANVLLATYGQPALTDFGLSVVAEQHEASMGVDALTPYHAAPEVLERTAATPVSDVYSLASTVYAMLAGRAPHQGSDESPDSIAALLLRVLQRDVPLLPREDAPASLRGALDAALSRDPALRTPTAAALASELQAVQRELGLEVTEPVVMAVPAAVDSPGAAAEALGIVLPPPPPAPPLPAPPDRPPLPTRSPNRAAEPDTPGSRGNGSGGGRPDVAEPSLDQLAALERALLGQPPPKAPVVPPDRARRPPPAPLRRRPDIPAPPRPPTPAPADAPSPTPPATPPAPPDPGIAPPPAPPPAAPASAPDVPAAPAPTAAAPHAAPPAPPALPASAPPPAAPAPAPDAPAAPAPTAAAPHAAPPAPPAAPVAPPTPTAPPAAPPSTEAPPAPAPPGAPAHDVASHPAPPQAPLGAAWPTQDVPAPPPIPAPSGEPSAPAAASAAPDSAPPAPPVVPPAPIPHPSPGPPAPPILPPPAEPLVPAAAATAPPGWPEADAEAEVVVEDDLPAWVTEAMGEAPPAQEAPVAPPQFAEVPEGDTTIERAAIRGYLPPQAPPPPPPVARDDRRAGRRGGRTLPVLVGILVAIALAMGVYVLMTKDGDDPGTADPGDEPVPPESAPPTSLVVPTGLKAVESDAGIQLDWDGDESDVYTVLVMSELGDPHVLPSESGTSLLVPAPSLDPDDAYCFAVAYLDGLQAAPETEEAFSPPACIRGASEDTVRPG